MAGYTIIKTVTDELLRLLRDGLCPEVIRDKASVGASNDLESADFMLSLCLYNIARADASLLGVPDNTSLALALEYMLTARFKGDADSVTAAEQLILGRAAEILAKNPFIYPEAHMPISVEMNTLSLYDKNSMTPKRPALFYRVVPVLISRAAEKPAPRVVEIAGG